MKKAIVIFGATGNLTYKKLLPAIDALIQKQHINEEDRVFLVARKKHELKDYIEIAKNQVKQYIDWEKMSRYLEYVCSDLGELKDYLKLKIRLEKNGFEDNTFYLALPPELFPQVAKGISESGLVLKTEYNKRVCFEKPFGENLESAKRINRELWKYFDESQIYRIDHYLGKEMIQNILVVRFANKIFEQTWNHSTIRNIVIVAKETEGVMSRGDYYDKIGALKDMLQSHLLQMAALTGMTKPETFNSQDIKNEKIKVFDNLEIEKDSVLFGQYEGYLEAEKIAKNSKTDTFVFAKAFIKNSKWDNIPIYFITGKQLNEKRSEIIINFKDDNTLTKIFDHAKKNNTKLIIKVAPEAGVMFQLNVKQPGLSNEIMSGKFDYCHTCNWVGNTSEAYEKLLLDLITNNKTLYTRWDEIEAMWKVIDNIKDENSKLYTYRDYNHLREIILQERGVDIDDL